MWKSSLEFWREEVRHAAEKFCLQINWGKEIKLRMTHSLPLLDDTRRYKTSLHDSYLKLLNETFYDFEFILGSF